MQDQYDAHFSGKLYEGPPAEGFIAVRPTAMPAVLGGHSVESAPDLRVEPARMADGLRAGILGKLRAAGRMVPSLDPAHFGPQAGSWLSLIEGSRVGGGLGGNLPGVEANFIQLPNDSTEKALVSAWAGFTAAALAEITHEGRQRQADHDAEMKEAQIRSEMDAGRSAQAGAQFAHALRLGQGHGRR